MKRRSFLATLAAYPVFVRSKGCTSQPIRQADMPSWKTSPVDMIYVGEYPNGRWIKDPFIKVNLDNGPVAVDGMTFSSSSMMNVKLSQWNEKTIEPTESSIAKLRNILRTNDGGAIELVWGPDADIFQTWIKMQEKESGHSYLIPLFKDDHSKSDFINTLAENTTRKFANNTSQWVEQDIYDLMNSDAKFYHIVKGNESNFWATGVEA